MTDDSDLEEVYNAERHLLATSEEPASEFLDDLKIGYARVPGAEGRL